MVAGAMTACDASLGPSRYSVGGSVTGLSGSGLVLELNSGDDVSISSSGSFVFSSGLDNGAAYSVAIQTQPANPAQTCTVRNGSGTIAQADVTNVIVTCQGPGHFAYVANLLSNNISAYALNSSTGVLTPIAGSPYAATGTAPTALLINGIFLYVANSGSNQVAVFSINGSVGTLSPTGTPSATGLAPAALSVDPSGSYLYVANSASNDISAYAIDPASGQLTELANSPFAVGLSPSSLASDPAGNYLYVANQGAGDISVLAIDPSSGSLSAVSGSPFPAGAGAASIAVAPSGTFAYVANRTAGSISEYSIDPATGALKAASGSPIGAPASASSLTVDPSGQHLYVSLVNGESAVSAYAINPATGALTLSGTTATAGSGAVGIVFDPGGSFALVANEATNNVSVFLVDSTSGALTQVSGSPFVSGTAPLAIAVE
jgi:YVTN family beta-propeller protein